jgi:hypothetical protein
MELWSSSFIAEDEPDWATCTLEEHVWKDVVTMHPAARRLIAAIQLGDKTIFMAVGAPVATAASAQRWKRRIYVPQWALETLGAEGEGEFVSVRWLSEDAFPHATRIVLRPHDSAFYYADAKKELETGLTRLGVVRQGDSITIPLKELGGFAVTFDVLVTEPASGAATPVLAEGEEVVMEFEEALDSGAQQIAPPSRPAPRPPTPVALEPAPLVAASASGGGSGLLPGTLFPAVEPGGGQILGGSPIKRMADGRAWNPWREDKPL